ncbi:hypothetical protein [Streptococcus thoraltensis]
MKIKIRLGDADVDRAVFIKSSQQALPLIVEEYECGKSKVLIYQR